MKRADRHISERDRLGALSDWPRVRMLRILESEELAVGEVASVIQVAQSTVSRHLKILADGGWVEGRNVGTATLYRMRAADDLEPAARQLWRAVRDHLSGPDIDED